MRCPTNNGTSALAELVGASKQFGRGSRTRLTDRERQVLRVAGDGLTNGEIAGQLHLSERTVRNYLSEAMGKLGAPTRVAAARQARDRGWL